MIKRIIQSALASWVLAAGSGLAMAETVSVLLVLEPRKQTGKAWDIGMGADPILCFEQGCAIGGGASRPATIVDGRVPLMPAAGLFGRKAGDCTNRLACIFRGIDLDSLGSETQPIDVDIDQHDRLEPVRLAVDRTCRVEDGRLDCYGGIFTRDYTIWVVPEAIAEEAGPAGLAEVLAGPMAESRRRYVEEFISEERDALPQAVSQLYSLLLGEPLEAHCAGNPRTIAATFELAGLTDVWGVRYTALLDDFLSYEQPLRLIATTQSRPRDFWALHDAVRRLHLLAEAQSARYLQAIEGIVLDQTETGSVLSAGDGALTAARRIAMDCRSGRGAKLAPVLPPSSG
jgi:hypothetical protein